MENNLFAKRKACHGCRDNFYNRSDSHCWCLKDAKMVWRWRINLWTPMDRRENFTRVRVLDCYHGQGNQRDIFLKALPQHLGGDPAEKALASLRAKNTRAAAKRNERGKERRA